MSRKPFISVVVPAFNASETIGGTLSSILTQNGADFEIIVIDDCSSDNTIGVLREIQQKYPIQLLENSKNLGHGGTRNKGIDAALGQYIVFVDADDQLLPGSLEAIQRKLIATAPELLLIGVNEFKRGRERPLTDAKLTKHLERHATFAVEDDPVALFWPPATWSKVYRKDYIVQRNIRFPDGFHQDIPWSAFATLKARKISVLRRPCYLYVRRGANSSTTNQMTTRTLVRAKQVSRIREGINFDDLSNEVVNYVVALATIHLLWGNKAAYRTIPDELQKDFFHESSRELARWDKVAKPSRSVNSDSLFPTRERVQLAKALRRNDWDRWKKTLQRRRRSLKIRNYLDPSRWGIFKSR